MAIYSHQLSSRIVKRFSIQKKYFALKKVSKIKDLFFNFQIQK